MLSSKNGVQIFGGFPKLIGIYDSEKIRYTVVLNDLDQGHQENVLTHDDFNIKLFTIDTNVFFDCNFERKLLEDEKVELKKFKKPEHLCNKNRSSLALYGSSQL